MNTSWIGPLLGGLAIGVVGVALLTGNGVDPDKDLIRRTSPFPVEGLSRPGDFWIGEARCTGDCSGHIAGWEWAGENDIRDRDDCPYDERMPSFNEGCRLYLSAAGYEAFTP